MQLNDTEKMALGINKKIRELCGNRVSDFVIQNVDEDINHKAFQIRFIAYNYYICLISYEKGIFGCSIKNGEYYISLENSQKWYDTADLDIFVKEFDGEIRLRIPDKYLEAKGWQ